MSTPRDEQPRRRRPASNPLRMVSLGGAVLSSVAVPILTGAPAHAAATSDGKDLRGVMPANETVMPSNQGIQPEGEHATHPLLPMVDAGKGGHGTKTGHGTKAAHGAKAAHGTKGGGHAAQAGQAGQATQYRVKPGDTLYDIAAELLGDGDRYPDIFSANQGRVESDGGRFTDPNMIMPDWVLDVPASASAQSTTPGSQSSDQQNAGQQGGDQQSSNPAPQSGDKQGSNPAPQSGDQQGSNPAPQSGDKQGSNPAPQSGDKQQPPAQDPSQDPTSQGGSQSADPSAQDGDSGWQGQSLDTWIDRARAILAANGIQVSHEAISITAEHESSGDPSAVNNYDGNAAAGHPSIGLMQTIQPTFDAYALDPYRDIYNPIDNIIAAVRYANATYGSLEDMVAGQCGGDCWHGY